MTTQKSFEAAFEELESIVEELEQGDLPLERSLEIFEQGVRLLRDCQQRLDAAEHKVEILLKGDDGKITATDFDEPEQ